MVTQSCTEDSQRATEGVQLALWESCTEWETIFCGVFQVMYYAWSERYGIRL